MWLESKTVNLFLPNFHDHSKLILLNFFFFSLITIINSFTTKILNFLLYNSHDVSSENLVLDQLENSLIDSFHFFS